MAGHIHDPAFTDIIFRRRRHEAGSQTVTAEVLNIEPDQASVFLHNVTDRLIGQSNGSNPTRADNRTKHGSFCDAGYLEPFAESLNGLDVTAVRDCDRLAAALLVRLGFPDRDLQALGDMA